MVEYLIGAAIGAVAGYMIREKLLNGKSAAIIRNLSDLQDENKILKSRLKENETELDERLSKIKDYREELRAQSIKNGDDSDQYDALKHKAIKLQTERDDLKNELERVKKNYALLEDKMKNNDK